MSFAEHGFVPDPVRDAAEMALATLCGDGDTVRTIIRGYLKPADGLQEELEQDNIVSLVGSLVGVVVASGEFFAPDSITCGRG